MTTNANRPAYRVETLDDAGNVTRTHWKQPTDRDENDIMVRIGRSCRMRSTRVIRVERGGKETIIHDRTD